MSLVYHNGHLLTIDPSKVAWS